MSNIAIEFQNVGKMYRLGRVGTGTLSHDLNRWWQMSVLGKEDSYLKIGQTTLVSVQMSNKWLVSPLERAPEDSFSDSILRL